MTQVKVDFPKRIRVRFPNDDGTHYIEGRNGLFPITAIEVFDGDYTVYIDGIGKRGRPIRGGLAVPHEAMDEVARRWLQQRGFLPKDRTPASLFNALVGLINEWLDRLIDAGKLAETKPVTRGEVHALAEQILHATGQNGSQPAGGKEVYRVSLQDFLSRYIHHDTPRSALIDLALEYNDELADMELAWENAGGCFYDVFTFQIRAEGSHLVVYLIDNREGKCPHGNDPDGCDLCLDYANDIGRIPFWLDGIIARCASCGEFTWLHDPDRRCTACNRPLCFSCHIAGPRCRDCDAEGEV